MTWAGVTQDQIDNSGRIHKQAFVISISTLFVACWIAAAVRFYIRFGIQRLVSLDDAFLILGLACLTTAYGVLLTIVDDAYTASAYLSPEGASLALQPGFLDLTFEYMKMIDVVLILAWCAITCVKLSFLFLFRRLIDRLQYLMIYWWAVLLYVLAVAGYGAAIYILTCPYFFNLRVVSCVTGAGLTRITQYSTSQIVLDILGDMMILAIPIHIIWKVKIGLKQKLALATSLCLTIVIVAITITKAAGMRIGQQYDSIWNCYFNVVSAEIGLLMTSATAFRTLYLSKTSANRHRHGEQDLSDTGERQWLALWWYKARSKYKSQRRERYPEKQISDESYSSISHGRISTEAPQIGLSVLPRGRKQNSDIMNSANDPYQSRLRMSHILEAPWDEMNETVMKEQPAVETRQLQAENCQEPKSVGKFSQ